MTTVVTHAILAIGAFRAVDRGRNKGAVGPVVAATLSMLPDIDVAWRRFASYGEPWGHRGMTHSIAFGIVVGAVGAFALRKRVRFRGGLAGGALFLALVTASHGALDALTDGGLGIAFFAPFDHTRHFLPIRPLPVSPITVNPLNPWLWRVLTVEALLFWPAGWALWLAGSRASRKAWVACVATLLTSALLWGYRIANG